MRIQNPVQLRVIFTVQYGQLQCYKNGWGDMYKLGKQEVH